MIAITKITEKMLPAPSDNKFSSGNIKNTNVNNSNKRQPNNVSPPTKQKALIICKAFCFPRPAKKPEKMIKITKAENII